MSSPNTPDSTTKGEGVVDGFGGVHVLWVSQADDGYSTCWYEYNGAYGEPTSWMEKKAKSVSLGSKAFSWSRFYKVYEFNRKILDARYYAIMGSPPPIEHSFTDFFGATYYKNVANHYAYITSILVVDTHRTQLETAKLIFEHEERHRVKDNRSLMEIDLTRFVDTYNLLKYLLMITHQVGDSKSTCPKPSEMDAPNQPTPINPGL